MPVVAGRRAEEAHDGLLRPRTRRVLQAVGVGLGDQIVHQVQAGVAADEDLLRLRAEDLRKEPLGRGQTGQLAVVARVNASVHAVGGV